MSEYASRIGAHLQQMDQLNRQLKDTSSPQPSRPEIYRPDVIGQIERIFEDVQDNLPLVSNASLKRVYRADGNYYRWLPGGAVVLEWGEKLEPTEEESEILREYGYEKPGMRRPDFLPNEIIAFDGQRILGGIKDSNFPESQIVQFLSDAGSGSFVSTLEKRWNEYEADQDRLFSDIAWILKGAESLVTSYRPWQSNSEPPRDAY